jgi:hypothetical protein
MHFAGEHADSLLLVAGLRCIAGHAAADALLADVKKGLL